MSGKNGNEKVSEIDNHVTEKYNVIRRLGKGAYGIVWKAVDRRSKETVAVKKIFDAFRNQTDAQRTFREIMFLLSFANHENIVQLIGLHKANNDQDIYLVFEYMETDLHNVIKRGNILKDIHKVFVMYQLLKATKYIHSGNVIHRDLKPSNILLNAQCHCKIADFGLARSVNQQQIGEGEGESTGSQCDPALTDYVATRWYRAPEILIASRRYTKGIDLWSLGCILGEMLLEKPLFPGSSTINQVERIMATLPTPTPEDLASVGAGYGLNLLDKRPAAVPRRTLRELLPPNISNSALNLICALIVFNPNRRLTAVEALEHPYVAEFHSRAHEPERGASVVPPLRDDVQLSIDEYRNKLYAMMDEKHRKHKNMSKSRIRRLTEHMRRDVTASNAAAAAAAAVVDTGAATGQEGGDSAAICKNFRIACDHARKAVSKAAQRAPKQQQQPQLPAEVPNGSSFHNVPAPGQAKSCLYLGQQQRRVSRSQRSIQSDQVGGSAGAAYEEARPADGYRVSTCQPKLRRGAKPPPPWPPHPIHQRFPISRTIGAGRSNIVVGTTASTSNYQLLSRGSRLSALPKPSSLDERTTAPAPGVRAKYITRMLPQNNNGLTKHFAPSSTSSTAVNPIERDATSTDRPKSLQQSRVVQNYLNQTVPVSSNLRRRDDRRIVPTKSRVIAANRSPLLDIDYSRLSTTAKQEQQQQQQQQQRRRQSQLDVTENRSRSASITRSQNLMNLVVVRRNSIEKTTSAAPRPAVIANSYNGAALNQRHGVITASAYRDLRNYGTMRW